MSGYDWSVGGQSIAGSSAALGVHSLTLADCMDHVIVPPRGWSSEWVVRSVRYSVSYRDGSILSSTACDALQSNLWPRYIVCRLSLSRIGHARVRRSVTDESSWTVERKIFVANVVHQRGLSVSIIFSELGGKHAQDRQMRVTWHI